MATHTAGVSVDGYTLTLAANPWNIVRTYNLTPGRELLFACRYRLGTASNFVVYVVRQLRGRPGRLEHGQDVLHSAAKRSCEAALRCALPGAGPAQPNSRNGGRLRPPDPGRNSGRQHGGGGHSGLGAAAEAQVPRRRGRRRHAGHPGQGAAGAHAHHARQLPGVLRGLGQLRGERLQGLRHDPECLRLEHRAHLHADAGETLLLRLPVPAGTASNLYVSAADNDYVGVTGTFLGTPSQGVWSTARLDFSVPPGGIAKLHFGQRGRPAVQRRELDASGAVSCAALTATGTVAGAALSSTRVVSGSSLSISGAASVGLQLRHRNHGQHTHHQQHGQSPGTSPRWATCPR